jgi:putative tryptophan/tyrosine transport system substrate-binding protein
MRSLAPGMQMKRRDFIAGLIFAASLKAAPAQQTASLRRRIGVVSPAAPVADLTEDTKNSDVYPGFFQELRRLGYIEGQNLTVERRSAEGVPDRYDEIAKDLIDRKVEVIFVTTTRMAVPFKRLTTIPIVVAGGDVLGSGLVESLAHPGGSVTGFSVDAGLQLYGKHLQLLRDLAPPSKKVGFLGPRSEWEGQFGRAVAGVANDMGIAIVGPPVEIPLEAPNYRTALTSMIGEGIDALLVSLAAENTKHARLIVDFAQERRLPAVYPNTTFVRYGALLVHAANLGEMGKGVARYVDMILKGAPPKDLPVQQPVKFEITINLKTAKAIGLTVPATLLASADKVIE